MKKIVFIIFYSLLLFSCGQRYDLAPDYSAIPKPDHVVIVIMENHEFTSIMDSTIAPFIYSIGYGSHAAVFLRSFGIGHPSQPNYFYLFSGDNQGILGNEKPDTSFITPNLAASLFYSGFSYASYAEGLPYEGFNGEIFERYTRKHNPITNWMGERINQVDSSVNKPFTAFPKNFSNLPTISFVIPDLDNSMHDGSIILGDTWLKENLGEYIKWCKTHNSLFILTFDEGNYEPTGNRIPTLIVGSMVKSIESVQIINHLNVLRTLELMYRLPICSLEEFVLPITDCWK